MMAVSLESIKIPKTGYKPSGLRTTTAYGSTLVRFRLRTILIFSKYSTVLQPHTHRWDAFREQILPVRFYPPEIRSPFGFTPTAVVPEADGLPIFPVQGLPYLRSI
jgi:hypothetical protein